MNLIDTCGWIEWLTNGALSDEYAPYFETVEELITPTSVQFELYKWVFRNSGAEVALQSIALTEQSTIVPLSTSIALLAADLSIENRLSFADAIIYATARFHRSTLITSDSHFEG
ncbi:MAG: type II toxin-antitoxin system VapC family toxin, partial [Sedimenticola sp.]